MASLQASSKGESVATTLKGMKGPAAGRQQWGQRKLDLGYTEEPLSLSFPEDAVWGLGLGLYFHLI